jgi:hypothetical protein
MAGGVERIQLWEIPKERDHLQDQRVDGKIGWGCRVDPVGSG